MPLFDPLIPENTVPFVGSEPCLFTDTGNCPLSFCYCLPVGRLAPSRTTKPGCEPIFIDGGIDVLVFDGLEGGTDETILLIPFGGLFVLAGAVDKGVSIMQSIRLHRRGESVWKSRLALQTGVYLL